MNPWWLEAGVVDPHWAERERERKADEERRKLLHEKAVERRKKQKKNAKRSKK